MKIAVVGCGAVGSFYGAKLCQAGHDVHFLLRSDYEQVRREGVCIRSFQGDFRVYPACARVPEEIGTCDLVVIGLKTTANKAFGHLLRPLVDDRARVLTLQNGLGNEEALERLFPARQIHGGLCFVCLNRISPGVIHHMEYGRIVLGSFRGADVEGARALAARFNEAGIDCQFTGDLARAHWEKLVWNIPFNGLGVAAVAGPGAWSASVGAPATRDRAGSTFATDRLLADEFWTGILRELMIEVIRAAGRLGYPVPESLADRQIERTRTMGAYKASTLLDFERGLPLEIESLFLEPLREAEQAGVAVPRLSTLCRILQQLDSGKSPSRAASPPHNPF